MTIASLAFEFPVSTGLVVGMSSIMVVQNEGPSQVLYNAR
jgi:hypothetical protein